MKLSDPGATTVSPMLTFEYDAMSRVTRESDPLGRETSYVYDAMGRLVEQNLSPFGNQLSGSHAYADPGSYTVTVTVDDDDGGSDQWQQAVTVLALFAATFIQDNNQDDDGCDCPCQCDPAIEGDAGSGNADFAPFRNFGLPADGMGLRDVFPRWSAFHNPHPILPLQFALPDGPLPE